jgi:hypothetical protein
LILDIQILFFNVLLNLIESSDIYN